MVKIKPFLGTIAHVMHRATTGEILIEVDSDGDDIEVYLSELAGPKALTLIGPTGKKLTFSNKDLLDLVENSEDDDGKPICS